MFNPKDIIEILAKNIKKTKSPFGIPKSISNTWQKNINLPKNGEYMLFTGLMYQFLPFIEKSTEYLEKYEDTNMAKYMGLMKYFSGYPSGLALSVITSRKEKKKAGDILKNIVYLLKKSKVDFGYDSDIDNYSGILLYDMGDNEGFIKHAKYVAEKLQKAGIKKIITVDPHTAYALKILFPKYTGISFTVKPYFELLNFKAKNNDFKITLHDPCFYGRYLNVSDVPRKILSNIGIATSEIRNSGEFTSCCGGPAESISPSLSKEIMEKRVKELEEPGKPIITMCPICLGNLQKSGADVEDFSSLLVKHL
jgi:Fe-S oxidoreductase